MGLPVWVFGLAYVIPFSLWVGWYYGNGWTFLPVLIVFGLIPVLDTWMGVNPQNLNPVELEKRNQQRAFQWLTWLYVPLQLGLLLFLSHWLAQGRWTALEWCGLTLSMGTISGGLGITLAHELGHKTSAWERFLSKVLLGSTCYMHFFIEHNRGHHLRVATPADPATARRGESLYRFYFRSVSGGWRSAWEIEARRLQKAHLSPWGWHNQMLWFTFLPLLFLSALLYLGGVWVGIFFLTQSVIGFSLLEAVNYLEHYGLQRREIQPGIYEPVQPKHSWNSDHVLTNILLFMLQRHSDHHAHQSRRYQTLRHFDESPQLPAGYATMLLVALVPPLWYKIMNPRVLEWQQQLATPPSGSDHTQGVLQ